MTVRPGGGSEGDMGGDAAMPAAVLVAVREDCDVAISRLRLRRLGRHLGLRDSAVEAAATAVSEIARNIVVHAGAGEIELRPVRERDRTGLRVIARDHGPGIADPAAAMRDGYSTAGGLGLGLPGAKRLMDEFALDSMPGEGTTVIMTKWAT